MLNHRYFSGKEEYRDLGILYILPQKYIDLPLLRCYRHNNIDDRRHDLIFNNGIKVNSSMYSRKTVLSYLEYCKLSPEINHYDHGIVGGFWFFDSLMKNYNMQYIKAKA